MFMFSLKLDLIYETWALNVLFLIKLKCSKNLLLSAHDAHESGILLNQAILGDQ